MAASVWQTAQVNESEALLQSMTTIAFLKCRLSKNKDFHLSVYRYLLPSCSMPSGCLEGARWYHVPSVSGPISTCVAVACGSSMRFDKSL